ncbi:hypothetical protein SARC_06119 [Sphaeroforma arctica JP610]|uniref:Uncharacterized protein n=1 Tax=Sphaeroforma arctica JP610 TaxID=667725 RepID=A0A0L0FXM9_9EUKA|nr:hypothetical protein SARC_06119 [Sphaeroforma arctica JP610]KNC81562.1 hypothetical protein SARC_06119 [Sphaeroforma arctica JP610]|eukprot:XP_014155464.1 hypothetical protein SARC_06119 [Sphaeroforma arctica JP610]
MCHCVGYRHDTDEEWAEMQKKEEWILERLKAKFPIRTSTAPLSYVSPPTFQHNAEKKEEER